MATCSASVRLAHLLVVTAALVSTVGLAGCGDDGGAPDLLPPGYDSNTTFSGGMDDGMDGGTGGGTDGGGTDGMNALPDGDGDLETPRKPQPKLEQSAAIKAGRSTK